MGYYRPKTYASEPEPWTDADYLGALLVVVGFIAALAFMAFAWVARCATQKDSP